jgi:hypothetical protein
MNSVCSICRCSLASSCYVKRVDIDFTINKDIKGLKESAKMTEILKIID